MNKAESSSGNSSQVQMEHVENQIVVYQPNETVRLDVRLENETVWLTQEQMALLFGRDQSVIARHIGNIFKEGELDRNSVYAKNAYTASDGKTYQVAFYNLDVVISVGYRVKSVQGLLRADADTSAARRLLQRAVVGRAGAGAFARRAGEAVAHPHRQLGEYGGARTL